MEKLTLFEMHFDGVQFGPSAIGTDGEDGTESGTEDLEVATGSGGSRLVRFLVASIILSVVASAIARKVRRSDDGMDIDEDVQDIAVEPIEA